MTRSSFSPGSDDPLSLPWAVGLLALSQTVGYGTVFYSYAIVAPHLAAEFGVGPSLPFTVISVAFLLSGLSGPMIGRMIDRLGGPRVMRTGSIAVAVVYLALAAAPGFAVAAMLVVLLQVVAVTVLYSAAFPTLALFGRQRGKQGMIWLGLVGGFSSTIFWPLSGWLVGAAGWRPTFLIFATLHLLVALPAHRFIASHRIEREADTLAAATGPAARDVPRRLAFWLIALAFGLTGVVSTALLVHMVPILDRSGLGPHVYVAAALAGPAMMGVRLAEILFWPRAHPIWSAGISALCFPMALITLVSGLPPLIAGCLFAVLYGAGHGLGVTSSGTLPLRVFGPDGYAELLGRLGAVRVVMGASGPAALAFGIEHGGLGPTLTVGMTIALAGVVPLLLLGRLLFLPPATPGDAR